MIRATGTIATTVSKRDSLALSSGRRRGVALQYMYRFVGRTTNWLYDHLRNVEAYQPFVICGVLENRDEFPDLRAWKLDRESFPRRAWRRLTGQRLLPTDVWHLKRHRPRLLHVHFGESVLNNFDLVRKLDIPWVVSFYGADVYQKSPNVAKKMYAELFSDAHRVLALGPAMKKRLEQVGCPSEKIVIHALGVDIKAIQAIPRSFESGDTLKILFAGTFREKKGVEYLIDAIARLRGAGTSLELHLAGEAASKSGDLETRAAILRRIERHGLEKVVIRHGFLPFHELMRLAYRCHVFAAPSVTAADGDSEGTPFVLQQMMASAMPVVSTFHSDIPFLLEGNHHLLVPERDSEALAAALSRFVNDPDSIRSDGLAVRKRMCQGFDAIQCGSRLSDIYDGLN